MSHEWGNYPENFIPKMYWGARAILERESSRPGKALYLLPDRQSFERLVGSQRDQDAFMDWINNEVLLIIEILPNRLIICWMRLICEMTRGTGSLPAE